MKNIGYWWSDKKDLRINGKELKRLVGEKNLNLVKLDLNLSLEEQGPFLIFIHKLSDLIIKADQNDHKSSQIIHAFEKYFESHPEMIVIDPFDNLKILLNRFQQYKIIQDCEPAHKESIFTPTFVQLDDHDVEANLIKLEQNHVSFPIVCKPLLAHGSSCAHQMSLIFSKKGLSDINPPCVAQTFINHNACLFKLFVIKDKYFVVERPSLKNFKAGDYPTLHFDSPDISKANSSSVLTELDKEDEDCNLEPPEPHKLDQIVLILRKLLGLKLFGIDVIIENKTGRYLIIDLNIFPGYDGVHNIMEVMRDMIVEEANLLLSSISSIKNCKESNKESTVYEIDSGIDTSDSCDENKRNIPPIRSERRKHLKNPANNSNVN